MIGFLMLLLTIYFEKKTNTFISKFKKGRHISDDFFINYFLTKNEEESITKACINSGLKLEILNQKNKASKENILLEINEEINDEIFNYFIAFISLGTYKNNLINVKNNIDKKYGKKKEEIEYLIEKLNKSLLLHLIIWITLFIIALSSINYLNGSKNVIASRPILTIIPILLVGLLFVDASLIYYFNLRKMNFVREKKHEK